MSFIDLFFVTQKKGEKKKSTESTPTIYFYVGGLSLKGEYIFYVVPLTL